MAQQPVVRDLSAGNSNFYDQAATREEAGGSLVLFNRVQRNQEELRRLRGQVEELRYQLEQLRKQTRQQYMDIEDRLTSAEAGASSSASSEPRLMHRAHGMQRPPPHHRRVPVPAMMPPVAKPIRPPLPRFRTGISVLPGRPSRTSSSSILTVI